MRQLTGSDLIFAQRMLPHFMAGKSPAEAARAVIEDDARLLAALLEDRQVSMSEGASGDGSAIISYGETEAATGLRTAITDRVYRRLTTGSTS